MQHAEPVQERRAGGSLDASHSHDLQWRPAWPSLSRLSCRRREAQVFSWSGCRTRRRHERAGARRYDGHGNGGRPGRPRHGSAGPIGPEGAEAQEEQKAKIYAFTQKANQKNRDLMQTRMFGRQREPAGVDGGREAVAARDRRRGSPRSSIRNRRSGSTRSSSRTKGRWLSPAPRSPPSSGSTRARKNTCRGS